MNQTEFNTQSERIILEIANQAQRKQAQMIRDNLIKNYIGEDEVITFESIYEKEKVKPRRAFFSTGHAYLDECLGGGIAEGELVIISGYTGNGKTSFCYDITRNMPKQNCLWLPFEESAEELAEKSIKYGQAPIHFYTPKQLPRDDIQWIEERILESVLKYNTKVVFIDNLHFITMQENQDFNKNGVFAKQLKRIASKFEIAIVLIGHLRKSQGGIHTMPTYEDIQGSSDVVKLANKVLAVWREAKKDLNGQINYTGYTKVAVQKVRGAYGKLENILFTWNKGVYAEQSAAALVNELNKDKYDF